MVRVQVIPNTKILDIADYDTYSICLEEGELLSLFCEDYGVAVDLAYPYRGGEKWAEEIVKKGHIVSIMDSFGISVYAGTTIDSHQRDWLLNHKQEFENQHFSGTIFHKNGSKKQFDSKTLSLSNEEVASQFIREVIPVQQAHHVKKKGVFPR